VRVAFMSTFMSVESMFLITSIVFSERTHVHVRYMQSPVRLSVCLSVCRLSSVCNARAPYSDG